MIIKDLITKERLIWAALVLAGIITIIIMGNRYSSLNKKYDYSVQNNKAYQSQLDTNKAQANVFQYTISQLESQNDSITKKLLATAKELGVKDKNISQLNYMLSHYTKTDTITIKGDTIFVKPDYKLDTCMGDEWMNTHLVLEYPNVIQVTPSVKSEKSVVFYTSRETVNPPKKFFLCRWFQKKHTVIKAVVDEKNPYIINDNNTFINTIE